MDDAPCLCDDEEGKRGKGCGERTKWSINSIIQYMELWHVSMIEKVYIEPAKNSARAKQKGFSSSSTAHPMGVHDGEL